MTRYTPFVLAVAAAYPQRDLFLAPAPVQQPTFVAAAQPGMYYPAAQAYAAPQPLYIEVPAGTASTGSAWFVAAALAGAAVGVGVATFAVEGRSAFDRRAVLAAAAAALPLAAAADEGTPGIKSGSIDNSSSRFNNSTLGGLGPTNLNDNTESSIAAIARANAEKLAAEKERAARKYQKTDADIEAEQEGKKNLILGIAGAGTLASGAFIIPNLTRLATKVASGGKDDGRSKAPARGKKAAPAPKTKNTAEKLFSAAFAREKF